jgi:hypothetical protein
VAITRRHVLAAMGGLAAAGAVGVGTTAWRWWDRPPGEGLAALSAEEHGFAQALAEAWMPPGGEPAISGAEARMGDFLDQVVASMAVQQGKLFRLLLHLLDEETVLTDAARFQNLSLERRQEVLAGWLGSPWFAQRQAVSAVMALISFGYTEHPEVVPMLKPMFTCGFGP